MTTGDHGEMCYEDLLRENAYLDERVGPTEECMHGLPTEPCTESDAGGSIVSFVQRSRCVRLVSYRLREVDLFPTYTYTGPFLLHGLYIEPHHCSTSGTKCGSSYLTTRFISLFLQGMQMNLDKPSSEATGTSATLLSLCATSDAKD